MFRLVFGSLSSEYSLDIIDDWKENPEVVPTLRLSIIVSSGQQEITKQLDELWSFQILRLFEIYVLEQLDLAILKKEDEDNEEGIEDERVEKLKLYSKKKLMIFKEVKTYLTLMQLVPTL